MVWVTLAPCIQNCDTIWWRHPMETFPALLAICAENSPVPGEFSVQRPVTRSFDVFFDVRPNNGWVNNGEAGNLRRHRAHCDVIVMNDRHVKRGQHFTSVKYILGSCIVFIACIHKRLFLDFVGDSHVLGMQHVMLQNQSTHNTFLTHFASNECKAFISANST